jgi:protocatechuate 3,4-dioxygenase beta subunit
MKMSTVAAALGVCLSAAILPAQQTVTGPPSLEGRVTAVDPPGAPVARARVVAVMNGRAGVPVFTDADGRFSLTPPDRGYRLRVMKSGYLTNELPGPRSTTRLEISLVRGAMLTGRLLDPQGEPRIGSRIAIRPESEASARPGAPFAITDDLGEFRYVAPAGRYAVSVVDVSVHCGGAPRQCTTLPGPSLGVELRAGAEANVVLMDGRQDSVSRMLAVAQDAIASMSALPRRTGGGPLPEGSIQGRVLSPNGTPLAGVAVRLGESVLSARTDSDGRYDIRGVGPGTYAITTERQGQAFVTPTRAGAALVPNVSVRAGEQVTGVDITLHRAGVIAGTIVDESGEPYEGLTVRALRARFVGGRMRLEAARAPARTTDHRGQYRLFDLSPGTYYVAVSEPPSAVIPGARPLQTAPFVYYPGRATTAEALPLHVDAGIEVSSASMTFAPYRGARIAGEARLSSGRPVTGTAILVSIAHPAAPAAEPLAAAIADGRFAFDHVPPGEYVVQAVGWKTWEASAEFGAASVSVSGAAAVQVAVTTAAAATVSGVIRLEGGGAAGAPASIRLRSVPADPDLVPALPIEAALTERIEIQADGRFTMTGLVGPRRIAATAPDGWWLKSATVNGANVADEPYVFGPGASNGRLEVVFASGAAAVSGRVLDTSRGGRAVVAFPADATRVYPHSRYLAIAHADAAGRFTLENLPPGDYSVAALDGPVEGDDWQDPGMLSGLTYAARRVTLREGEHVTVDLRTAAPR